MIVIDTETTGLDPEAHSLLSLGAIDLSDPSNQFYSECRVFPGAHIEDKALEVTGFTRADITDESKEPPEILLQAFVRWSEKITDRTLAGHNVCFDTNFLRASFLRAGLKYPFAHRTIDTHSLTYMHMIKRKLEPPFNIEHHRTSITSDFVFTYVGLDISRPQHNSLEDAKLTAEAISRLIYDQPLLPEYRDTPIPWLDSKY
jgi:DNA polymerase-3 subunit epsilon